MFYPANGFAHCKISEAAKEKMKPIVKLMLEASALQYEDKSLQASYFASLLSLLLIDMIRLGEWGDSSFFPLFRKGFLFASFRSAIFSPCILQHGAVILCRFIVFQYTIILFEVKAFVHKVYCLHPQFHSTHRLQIPYHTFHTPDN